VATSLTGWLENPSTDRGIRFASDEGWTFHTYAEIASGAGRRAQVLREHVSAEDVVCLLMGTGPAFVETFVGALAVGAVPCVIPPPTALESMSTYEAHAARLLRSARPQLVCTDAVEGTVVRAVIERSNLAVRCLLAEEIPRDPAAPPALPSPGGDDPVLLQFTSGSTRTPRGIAVSRGNLEANLHTIRQWLRLTRDDTTCSWLPVYHDMGLLGCLLTPIVTQTDTCIMRPEQFVRDPLRWLECFGARGATLTAMPSFGYGYVAKRVTEHELEGMTFDHWRACIVGAERIDPVALGSFWTLLRGHGFRRTSFLPAYGLAEATLTVTGAGLSEAPFAVRPAWATMAFGETVQVLERALVGDDAVGDGDGWIVASGRPHPGTFVGVVDEDGRPLAPGCFGEIAVEGPSVAAAAGSDPDGSKLLSRRRLQTGDAGFVLDGHLFVVGRMGDRIKVRGRHLYAEDLESRLAAVPGVPRGRCVVVPGVAGGQEHSLLVLVEAHRGPWVEPAIVALRRAAGENTNVDVRCVPRGTIPRTSSGKPRRRALWRRLAAEAAPADARATSGALDGG
jgi:acyl-CoA synthetase (AMP-forming)/AMP-acid ligase II